MLWLSRAQPIRQRDEREKRRAQSSDGAAHAIDLFRVNAVAVDNQQMRHAPPKIFAHQQRQQDRAQELIEGQWPEARLHFLRGICGELVELTYRNLLHEAPTFGLAQSTTRASRHFK